MRPVDGEAYIIANYIDVALFDWHKYELVGSQLFVVNNKI